MWESTCTGKAGTCDSNGRKSYCLRNTLTTFVIHALAVADSGRVCFKMQGDAISSGFACISRRFSAGLVGSSARKTLQWRVFSGTSARKTVQWTVFSGTSAWKTVQWTVFSEDGSADPRLTGRQTPEASQGKSTQKCRQRRRNCASGILETHSSNCNLQILRLRLADARLRSG